MQADLPLCCSHMAKTGFLKVRLICIVMTLNIGTNTCANRVDPDEIATVRVYTVCLYRVDPD